MLLGDRNLAETFANVVTSLPFVALGIKAPRYGSTKCHIVTNIDYYYFPYAFVFTVTQKESQL